MNKSFLAFASITKKIIMAFAGLFLAMFLVVHLIINLFLLKGDGGAMFNEFAHFMSHNYLLKVLEVVLIGTFVIHIIYGIILQIQNWMSRPVRYRITNKTKTPFLSKYMIYTGAVILIFLIIHFMDFWFKRIGVVPNHTFLSDGEPDFYTMTIDLFSNGLYSGFYIVLIILMGFHLNHAFQSGFQTLGLDHSKYTPAIKAIATIYSIIITIGFCIIPLFFLLVYRN